ncbi:MULTISPECIES: M16 family metallopeptidase [Nocardiopsis]|uniref:Peptidase M16 domain protein n=1 Tax=Nocardiopsis dassonvillei (strain ATCC 23218 / DSM 43111 / CIP 107115 / JCM 7437 / KCTC 9190 / NBRC 14626 / NCTC 10488 / NRRL B-5397 / IMRU 509) TaxID=446468 RepID=D7AW87_NOCDD|nr:MULTISPECIES: pitrilysin family protein [Nocardiopsis]ADH65853.1 peptidase M16 domain protein [Nocardiopsis dassonvillei subsp. dassonvillei DSM 43111]APC34189.1 peptidase M16 [Nocardiopsis dassonvillei]ASU57066.1 insulinase family protein [Nocardiopsis dassonvillei]NKY80437.1 insulinase family protein [Nocardiopsis dassonvillei]VEI91874.1 Peptidase M16 inactive domain [Nocardiopsis dassonvillei]
MPHKSRPDLGAVASYTFPKPRRLTVGGGTVVAIDVPGQQLVSLRLVHPHGGAAEPLDAMGVSALTSEVLEDGPNGNSSLAPALERHGAEWVSRVNWDAFITGLDAPAGRLPEAVRLFADAVRRPALNPDDVVRRRDQLLERFWLEAASASTLAMRSLGGQLFTGRYATPLAGGPVKLADVTPETVAAFHADSVASVAGTLVVVGDLTGIDLEDLGKTVFGDAAAVRAPEPTEPAPPPGELPRVLIVDRPGSVQSALVIAHRAPSRSQVDLPRAEGVSEVLGGMFTSRLNLELRERLGYTYGAGSRFDLRRDSGVFFMSAQVEADTTAHSVTSSLEQVAKLRESGVTEEELAAVRDSNTVGLPVTYATARAMAGALVDMVVHDLPEDHVDRVRAGYERLTKESLDSAATEYLRPEESVVVVVGDAERLRQPLTDTGVGPVEVRTPDSLWT